MRRYHLPMIARIEGRLLSIQSGAALVRVAMGDSVGGAVPGGHSGGMSGGGGQSGGGAHSGSGLTYEVLLTGYTAARLGGSIDQMVTLHTLHWLEGSAQGASMFPRLAGFMSPEDRRFFELFTTCKGIGHRKALRAMTLSTGQIASAIADRDVALLKSLSEIGARTAETIVATLHGKVDAFVSADAYGDASGEAAAAAPTSGLAREAMEVLMQLGESRAQVVAWIDQAMRESDRPTDVQGLVARVYQIKAGG